VASASLLVALGGCGDDDDDAASDELREQVDELESESAELRDRVEELEADNAELRAELESPEATAPETAMPTAPSTTEEESPSTTAAADSLDTTSAPDSEVNGAPDGETYLVGTFDPNVLPAGEPDSVSVLAVGPIGSSTPVVVRNNTDETVEVRLTATARDPAGELVGSGEDQGLEPPFVAPGGIAIGYVFLGIDEPPAGTTIDVTASGGDVDEEFGKIPASITEHNFVAGEFGGQVVGVARNDNDIRMEGPISVLVMCFDDGGAPLSTSSGFTNVDALDPGQEGSFSVDLFSDDACPRYLVGASGFTF
jgi:hypothetical protein